MISTYPPSEALQPYVSFFYDFKWEAKDYDNGIKEYALPSGKGFMVFQNKGRFYGSWGNEVVKVPKYYTIGQQITTYTLLSDFDVMEITGVAFTPTGLYNMFGMDMTLMVNSLLETEEIIGKEFSSFKNAYETARLPKERIDIIEQMLLNCLDGKVHTGSIVDMAITMMHASLGCTAIKDISAKLNVSQRYFQKKFKLNVGVSPSVYNRIIRFTYLFSEFDLDGQSDYQTLSALYNYYDFSHFYRDFTKYCGETPKKFHIDKFNFIKEAFISNPIFLRHLQ